MEIKFKEYGKMGLISQELSRDKIYLIANDFIVIYLIIMQQTNWLTPIFYLILDIAILRCRDKDLT